MANTIIRDCCETGLVWVEKKPDIAIPTIGQDGKEDGDYENVDLNFYRCRFCGAIQVDVE